MKVEKRSRRLDYAGETIGRVAIDFVEDLVPFAQGLAPGNYGVTLRDPPGPVRLAIAIESGHALCVEVGRAPDGPALTGALLRSLPVERIVRETSWMVAYEERLFPRAAWDEYQRWADEVADKPAFGKPGLLRPEPIPLLEHPDEIIDSEYVRGWMPVTGRPGGLEQLKAAKRHRPRRGARLPDDLLEDVARVYRAHSTSPTAAVAEKFYVARSTAGRYVSRARERGFLGPAIGRKAGETAR